MEQMINTVKELLREEYGDSPATCWLATTNAAGRATTRTMVLRELSVNGGLLFVSDRHTRKDDHLRERPLCEVCFWLPTMNTQVRVQGEAVVVDAMNDHGIRDSWWERMDERSVLVFTGKRGTPEDVPMPSRFELITITPSWISVEDYSQTPPTEETWGKRDE